MVSCIQKLRMLQIPFAWRNSVGMIGPVFDCCRSARASATVSSRQSWEVFFLSLHEFDCFHQAFGYLLYWPKFLIELLTMTNRSAPPSPCYSPLALGCVNIYRQNN